MTQASAATLSPEPGQSRYGALAAALRQRLVGGEWPPGGNLPPETQLAAEHSVALGTLRRALEVLAEQGLIERRHGRGTFVRSGLAGAPMLRFFRFGTASGKPTADVPASHILSRRATAATADVARHLGLAGGEPVLRLQRLRSLGQQPCLLEDIWLPLPLFAPLQDSLTRSWGDLLYPLFAQRCGVHVNRATDTISFGRLNAAQARCLKLDNGDACALVTRQAFDLAGRCVELRHSRGNAQAFSYTVTIT